MGLRVSTSSVRVAMFVPTPVPAPAPIYVHVYTYVYYVYIYKYIYIYIYIYQGLRLFFYRDMHKEAHKPNQPTTPRPLFVTRKVWNFSLKFFLAPKFEILGKKFPTVEKPTVEKPSS